MTSQKQIIANRKNARKSTGPVTVQGKEITARNAIKHGLLSGHLLLPDESEIQLEQLRNSIFSSLAPRGELEFFLAERVLAAAWRLQRLIRIETEMMADDLQRKTTPSAFDLVFGNRHKQPTLGSAVARNLSESDNYSKLRRYETSIERGLFRALHELQSLRTAKKTDPIATLESDVTL